MEADHLLDAAAIWVIPALSPARGGWNLGWPLVGSVSCSHLPEILPHSSELQLCLEVHHVAEDQVPDLYNMGTFLAGGRAWCDLRVLFTFRPPCRAPRTPCRSTC